MELKLDVRNRMEQLRDETNADSLVEVVRKSLAVYDYIWSQRKMGSKILIQDTKGTRELIIL